MKKLLFILLLASCNSLEEIKFNKTEWNKSSDGFYLNREKMTKDLMENHLKTGMKYSEVIELLGDPEKYSNIESNTMVYDVSIKYVWNDIDPKVEKQLRFKFSNDSLIQSFGIVNSKK